MIFNMGGVYGVVKYWLIEKYVEFVRWFIEVYYDILVFVICGLVEKEVVVWIEEKINYFCVCSMVD